MKIFSFEYWYANHVSSHKGNFPKEKKITQKPGMGRGVLLPESEYNTIPAPDIMAVSE